ncbi:sensor histidine kinase [Streptomyces polyrhachis]|uniref:histidine kinase n=1 Tax=Streptomyces polyrhachis TaxID=1282885 RepID=A0ABW2G9G8_9ACTN
MNNGQARPSVRGRLAAGAAAAALAGLVGAWAYARAGGSAAEVVRDLSVGWAYAAAGLVAWWRRPGNLVGPLMLIEGVVWFAGNLQGSGVPALFAAGAWGEGLNLAVLAHLLVVYPDGRLTGRRARTLVAACYGVTVGGGLLRALTFDPAVHTDVTYLSCPDICGPNALLVPAAADLFPYVDGAYRVVGWILSAALAALVVRRWRRASTARRRALLPAWIALLLAVLVMLWDVLVVLLPVGGPAFEQGLTLLSDLTQTAVPIAFLTGLLRMRLQRAGVGGLVMEVGADSDPGRLRAALADVLADPDLRLGLWDEERAGYTDEAGAAVQPAARGCVRVDSSRGAPLALLRHDPALEADAGLLEAAVAALRLALENVWLRGQAREVGARIVRAADSERRRLERDLHDGAQTRLVFTLMTLRRVETRLADHPDEEVRRSLAEARESLHAAVEELRALAHGIHPAVLTRDGLAPALKELAGQTALPVVVAAEERRFDAVTEATAYFTVSEALSNAAKHAGARAISVSARSRAGRLVVETVDDGVGGADTALGTGLRGIADRVAAVGGVLRVHSPAGQGTRVVAELPCE